MADRFWVGGSGNWSDDDNHWATSTGGTAADGNKPTSSDIAIFDASSGTGTCTIDENVSVLGINQGVSTITITNTTYTITVGTSGGVFSAGTFNGGSGAITINGYLL